MEFTGRVKAILPKRSGTSARTGNEWVALPFIFEYFEHETDRYADRVVLETFDTKVIDNIKEGMEVRCGFSHNVREYEGKTYNDYLNPESAIKLEGCMIEPALADAEMGERFQFVRTGYFCKDTKHENTFNRIVGLKASYVKK